MLKIVGLPGSLRKGSFNRAMLAAALELVPEGCEAEMVSFHDIPVYNGDLEEVGGLPPAAAALKDVIAGGDGLLLATPEYNSSIPGALKNALDWLTRPPGDAGRVFGDLPVGLMGASPGRGGTRFSQTAWLPVLRALGTRPFFAGSLFLDGAHKLFDGQLNLTDDATRARLKSYVDGFTRFVAENAEARRSRRREA
jgi:NAD(P)H-dependent FMN reductase